MPLVLAKLAFNNLSKPDFLRVNHAVLESYLSAISQQLIKEHGSSARPVTMTDVWVLTYCEAGLKENGFVDPAFQHNLGEVGFFPLPENIKFWNGSTAPPWNRLTSLETNVFHFLLYLGQLKSRKVRTVDGVAIYSGLFSEARTPDEIAQSARILAGVVHGYFYGGKYSDQKAPVAYLIQGYAARTDLAALMSKTRFKLANTSIIANRARNIEQALIEMQL